MSPQANVFLSSSPVHLAIETHDSLISLLEYYYFLTSSLQRNIVIIFHSKSFALMEMFGIIPPIFVQPFRKSKSPKISVCEYFWISAHFWISWYLAKWKTEGVYDVGDFRGDGTFCQWTRNQGLERPFQLTEVLLKIF